MFRIPDKVWAETPELAKTLQVIQGELYKLVKKGATGQGGTVVNQVIKGARDDRTSPEVEVHDETLGDYTIHGDLFVDGTIHGVVGDTTAITPSVSDVTLSRAMSTIYQNSEDTYKDVRISVEVSGEVEGEDIGTTTRIDDGDSPYTVLSTDTIIFCDTDGGAITANLPAGVDGTFYKLINCGSGGYDLTVDPNGTEELFNAGAGVASTVADGEVIDIHYNSTEGWF